MADTTKRNSYNRKRPNQLNRQNIKDVRYNNSSSAYDYGVREFTKPLKPVLTEYELHRKMQINKAIQRKKQEAQRRHKIHAHRIRQAKKLTLVNLVLISILMAYSAGTLVFVLNILDNNNEVKLEINSKQQIINEQEKRISEANIALANSVDVHEIERIAMEELGMKLPSSDQIVYITLPKNRDFIEYKEIQEIKDKPIIKDSNEEIEDVDNILDDILMEANNKTDESDITDETQDDLNDNETIEDNESDEEISMDSAGTSDTQSSIISLP